MDHCGEWDLSSVQPRRRSSEPQVVTAQLVDRPAAHQLHVAFDFGSEIFKRPFNAGLTRGRQSIQVKSPSRTRLRAHSFVGFSWGGWSLGSTADKMAKDRSDLAVVAALAPVKLGDIEKETWRWKSNSSIYSSDCDVTDFGKFSGVARLGGAEEGDWLRGRSSGCRPYRAIRRYGRQSRLS